MTAEEKNIVKELIEKEKENTKCAELRTKYQMRKNLQKTRDVLFCLKYGFERNINERKTTITEMENYLLFINDIINNIKDVDLWE